TAPLRSLVIQLVRRGMSQADAPHVAASQVGGVDYFVTTDDRRARQVRRSIAAGRLTVAVVNPVVLQLQGTI
ncbi:MAG: hypothetical protein ACRDI2_09550, partial [Chloroflexota bacterium]